MLNLFNNSIAFDGDVFRNVVSLRESRDLFADLSEGDETASRIAAAAEMRTKERIPQGLIQRGFHYTTAIDYPFATEPFLSTRFGDGSFGVWYGSLALETSIRETAFHMYRAESAVEGLQEIVIRERAVYLVLCQAVLIDLTGKEVDFPDLLSDDYLFTQGVAKRLNREGHPGLLAPAARHRGGKNLAVFNPEILSDPRNHCYLTYYFDPAAKSLTVERQRGKELFHLAW